jgi:hypothetical protein
MRAPIQIDGYCWLYTELVKFGSTLHFDEYDGSLYLLQTDGKGRTNKLYMYRLDKVDRFLTRYAIVSRP